MNTDQHPDASTTPSELPLLSDDRVNAIENSLFAEISRDRSTRRARRTGVWAIAGAAAAVIVVAAVIAPSVATLVGGGATTESAVAPSAPLEDSGAGGTAESGAVGDEMMATEDGDRAVGADTAATDRDIITTASATLVVEDVPTTVELIAEAAESRDGYVESMSVGASGQVLPVDPMTGTAYDSTVPYPPYPPTPDGAWVTVRVPADALPSLVDQLSGLGEVTASTINRQDVTEVTVDLQARVGAAQASVDRLEALMAEAGSLTDLIAAESALAERQATLESYQQQLKYYDEQVAMSTLTVTLTEPVESVEANPAGFGDGLAAGWNGLIATLNGIVIAIGFLIPWLVVVAIAGLIVWGIIALIRRRKRVPKEPVAARTTDADTDSGPQI